MKTYNQLKDQLRRLSAHCEHNEKNSARVQKWQKDARNKSPLYSLFGKVLKDLLNESEAAKVKIGDLVKVHRPPWYRTSGKGPYTYGRIVDVNVRGSFRVKVEEDGTSYEVRKKKSDLRRVTELEAIADSNGMYP